MSIKKELSLIFRAISIIKEMMPHYFTYMISHAIVSGISPYVSLYFSGKIVDEIVEKSPVEHIIQLVIILVLSTFLFEMLNQFLWGRIRVNQLIFDSWEELYLNKKGFSLDYKQIEDPKVRALRQKIIDMRELGGLKQLILQLMFVFNNVVSIIVAIIMLLRLFCASTESFSWVGKFVNSWAGTFSIMIVLVISSILIVNITKTGSKSMRQKSKNISTIQKTSHYYIDEYLDDVKVGKDIRIYKQQDLILSSLFLMINKYSTVVSKFRNEQWSMIGKRDVITYVVKGVGYIYIGLKALTGAIGAGSIVEFSGVISILINSLGGITSRITEIFLNNKYLENFFEYIDLCSEMKKETQDLGRITKTDFAFKNVSFKYSDSEKLALNNISLEFKSGEKIAVVGLNGSGKTTFIKLLCRLYDPDEGIITFNGKNVRELDYLKYQTLFSVVFQDFRLFSFSIANNVAASENYDEDKVWDSLQKANILERVKQTKKGIETNIYKDFNSKGIEISGGEAQKIAIARALYRDAPIMIFDEPTSALDPVAESEIYEMINSVVTDKLIIYISHRLSSCKFCDRIIVFDDGIVVQQGSHEELIKNKEGEYYKLWHAQAQYYSPDVGDVQ